MKMKREIHTIFNVHILRGNQRICKANYSVFLRFRNLKYRQLAELKPDQFSQLFSTASCESTTNSYGTQCIYNTSSLILVI